MPAQRPTEARCPRQLADHAFLSDWRGAALVDMSGCIDWLCLPRFDSPACLAAIVGTPQHGCWSLAPAGRVLRSRQSYQHDSLMVQTELEVAEGRVRVPDGRQMDPRQRMLGNIPQALTHVGLINSATIRAAIARNGGRPQPHGPRPDLQPELPR